MSDLEAAMDTERERMLVLSAELEGSELRHQRQIIEAVASETARCLQIARMWPDNLMAKEIAKRIQNGR